MTTKRKGRSPPPSKNGQPPAALGAGTGPPDPGSRGPMSLPQRSAGVRVNEDTALTLASVFACVRVIAEDGGKLPWNVYRRRAGGGRDRLDDAPADWLLDVQANPETPAYHWRETILAHALTWGNGYSEIERDYVGRPVWLWQLTPDRVMPDRTASGRLVYDVHNPRSPNTVLDAEDVFHLRGLGFDGLVGYPVVRLFARAIGVGIALEEQAASFSANDSTPGGILESPQRLNEEARRNLRESFERVHGGPGRKRRLAVLEGGITWHQTGLPPEDAQFLQQRQFTPTEMARVFRVPPHKIGDLTRSTYSNIEQQSIEYVTDTLLPWVVRMEQEANIKMFGRNSRGNVFTKMDLKALLRGDTTAQTNHIHQMLGDGVFDVNEAREYLDLNPIGKDGDKRFVPVNMQLLEKAGEEPPAPPKLPPAPPNQGTPAPPEEDKPPPEPPAEPAATSFSVHDVLLPVWEDAHARILRREQQRSEDAQKRTGDPASWLEKHATEHEAWVKETLAACVRATQLARQGQDAGWEVIASVLAARHMGNLRERLKETQSDAP